MAEENSQATPEGETPARRSRISGEERRRQIIESAATLFSQKGFRGTTTREIAQTVGVSEAMLFKHFATKEELYAAIIEVKSHAVHALDAVVAAAEREDDAEVLRALAREMIERIGGDSTLLRLTLFSALEGHELSEMFFGKHHKVFYDHLAAYIRTRIEDGAFRPIDPLLAARAFIGMVVHHRLLHEIFGVPMHQSHEDTVATYVDLFLTGLIKLPAVSKTTGRR